MKYKLRLSKTKQNKTNNEKKKTQSLNQLKRQLTELEVICIS